MVAKTYNFLLLLAVSYYLLGVVFYDYLSMQTGFTFVDEIFTQIFLVVYVAVQIGRRKLDRYIVYITFLAVLYFLYSVFVVKSNAVTIVLSDMMVVVKPVVAFGMFFFLAKESNKSVYYYPLIKILILSVVGGILCAYLIYGQVFVAVFFGHPSRLATAIFCSAIFYLYVCRTHEGVALPLFSYMLILAVALLSYRTKAYGFFVISIFFVTFLLLARSRNKRGLSLKGFLYCAVASSAAIYFSWGKIYLYFIYGAADKEIWARPVMYLTAGKIALDYFPFGSGFASFGSYFSGVEYSSMYSKYDIDGVYGLTEGASMFINDALYPMVVGQFGVFGLMLVLYSAFRLIKYSYQHYIIYYNPVCFFSVISMITFIAIESIADSTLVQNRGVFVMCVLGLWIGKVSRDFSTNRSIL